MLNLLRTYFGYTSFRPLQREIVDNVLQGRHSFVLMPTGGGKSLCYQLPALKLSGITLVISPLIALMKDQVDSLTANGISAEFLNSSLWAAQVEEIEAKAVAGELKLLYLAPERLAGSQNFIKRLNVSLIAIDEAHCISEWGHDFRPDYRNLKSLKEIFPEVPIIALTSTATAKVREDILRQLEIPGASVFVSSFDRENLILSVINKKNALVKLLEILRQHKGESAIIYCFSRRETEELAEDLRANGLSALPYHAGMNNAARKEAQEKFIRDEVDIMTATIAFGMGIDKPNVRLVAHYTFPKSLEGYYQEIGRAGRDGIKSECVMFYTFADKRKHDFFIDQTEDLEERKNQQEKLRKVLDFASGSTCRRKYLLQYFGEDFESGNCGACDICLSHKERFDATEIAQKIISCVLRTGQVFGTNHVIDVLLGSKNKQILARGHERLPVFGIAGDFDKDELRRIVDSLLSVGLLGKKEGQYPSLGVSDKGMGFIKNRESLELLKFKRQELKFKRPEEIAEKREDFDVDLFEKLRVLRRRLAEEMNVPPFVVFGDVALREMSRFLPVDNEGFGRITGVGAKKLARFSDDFLAVIKAHVEEHGLRTGAVPERGRAKTARHEKTGAAVVKGLSLAKIAAEQGVTVRTIVSHIEKLMKDGQELDIEYLLPASEERGRCERAFEKCGTERLAPVFEELGGEVDYETLRLVRTWITRGGK